MVSSTFSFKALASIISIISAANAHMIMKTPIPYGRGSINSSPLVNDGSDYPCKNIFDMTDPVNDVNHLAIGESNTLSFTGSAVHGGGSCQVSLTKDLRPTKGSTWMVIKSIEGGCPANVDGNLPADPNGSGASTFQYSIPEGIAPGEYTLAWTWFNRIGNREMYMNCGRANIVASKKRYAPTPKKVEERAAGFPDLFKANLDIFDCKIEETKNFIFPQPGAVVQSAAAANFVSTCKGGAAPTGGAVSNPDPGSGSGSGSGASSAVATTAAVPTATSAAAGGAPTGGFATGGFASGGAGGMATSSVAVSSAFGSQPTGGPGVFASGAASQPAAAPTANSAPQPSASAAPAAPSSGSAGGGSSSSGSGSNVPASGSNTPGSSCSAEGAWFCAAGGQSFQRCASGAWSAPMQVAAGTSCSPGQSMNLSMSVITGGSHKRGPGHRHPKRVVQLST